MFRYSGSKYRLRRHLRPPPANVTTIVESLAGSAKYGCHYKPERLILYEKNRDVRELWEWLIKHATVERLHEIEAMRPKEKIDVRELALSKQEQTLMRLTCSGAYVGQLSSFVLYPQHSVNFKKIILALDWIKSSVKIGGDDFAQSLEHNGDPNVLFFVDPPYLKTAPNYIDKTSRKDLSNDLTTGEINAYVSEITSPVIFTYGSDAPEVFPDFNWDPPIETKVPRIRTGGTKIRLEHVYYGNWPGNS